MYVCMYVCIYIYIYIGLVLPLLGALPGAALFLSRFVFSLSCCSFWFLLSFFVLFLQSYSFSEEPLLAAAAAAVAVAVAAPAVMKNDQSTMRDLEARETAVPRVLPLLGTLPGATARADARSSHAYGQFWVALLV